jgi:hypothetical protein
MAAATVRGTVGRAVAATVLGSALTLGPLALIATAQIATAQIAAAQIAAAQQPSDPNGCGSASCGGGGGGAPGDVDVLGESFTKHPGGGGFSLPKTGGDSARYLLLGACAAGGALSLRKLARRT